MNTNKFALRAAMLAALGVGGLPHLAQAAMMKIGTPIKLSTEMVNAGSIAAAMTFSSTNNVQIDISPIAGRNVSDTTPIEMRLTLTGGATFSTAPTAAKFLCTYGATPVAATNVITGPQTATFKLPNGVVGASPICSLEDGAISLNSGQVDYGMIVSGVMKNGDEIIEIKAAGSIITFGQECVMGLTTKNVTIDVASPSSSTKFVSNLDSSKKTIQTAALGTFTYTGSLETIYSLDSNKLPAEIKDCSTILNTLTISVTGSPLVSGMSLWTDTHTTLCGGDPGAAMKVVGSSSTVTFAAVTYAQNTPITVCYAVDGTARIDKGKVTYTLAGLDKDPAIKGNFTPNTIDTTLADFYKNGTSVKVLNIPSPSDTRDKLNIRIYNMGANSADVYGVLYANTDNTTVKKIKIGSVESIKIATIPPRGVVVVQSTALATPFQVVGWSGRAWMQIEGESQDIRVQAMMRSGGTTGPLFNFSDRVLEDGGSFCRSGTCK